MVEKITKMKRIWRRWWRRLLWGKDGEGWEENEAWRRPAAHRVDTTLSRLCGYL